jgi:hypothetical protein
LLCGALDFASELDTRGQLLQSLEHCILVDLARHVLGGLDCDVDWRFSRWRSPIRRLLDQGIELLAGAAGGKPVANVTLCRQTGQYQNADAASDPGERGTDFIDVPPARLVIIRKQHNVGAT